VDVRFAFWFVPGICLGAFLGGVITAYINPVLLLWLFVIFLVRCRRTYDLYLLGEIGS